MGARNGRLVLEVSVDALGEIEYAGKVYEVLPPNGDDYEQMIDLGIMSGRLTALAAQENPDEAALAETGEIAREILALRRRLIEQMAPALFADGTWDKLRMTQQRAISDYCFDLVRRHDAVSSAQGDDASGEDSPGSALEHASATTTA